MGSYLDDRGFLARCTILEFVGRRCRSDIESLEVVSVFDGDVVWELQSRLHCMNQIQAEPAGAPYVGLMGRKLTAVARTRRPAVRLVPPQG